MKNNKNLYQARQAILLLTILLACIFTDELCLALCFYRTLLYLTVLVALICCVHEQTVQSQKYLHFDTLISIERGETVRKSSHRKGSKGGVLCSRFVMSRGRGSGMTKVCVYL